MNKQEIEKAIAYWKEFKEEIPELKESYPETEQMLDKQEVFVATAIYCMEQQLTNGWIPVNKKMPEFDQNCLVTTDSGEIYTSKFYGYGEECQGFRKYPDGVWEINQCELEVIAWQHLPLKYNEDVDGED